MAREERDKLGAALVDAADARGKSAGRIERIRELLAAGADPNWSNEHGDAALHWAANSGNREGIAALLEAGADLEAKDRGGLTPLLAAVHGNQAWAVGDLLAAGADPLARGADGKTALALAKTAGYREMEALLEERVRAEGALGRRLAALEAAGREAGADLRELRAEVKELRSLLRAALGLEGPEGEPGGAAARTRAPRSQGGG